MCPNSSIGAMRVVWTLLLLTTVTLAGCSDDPAPEVEDPTFDEFDAPVAPDRGVIRGVVVDTAIVPLAGATVTLAGLERSTTTNENGAFQFDDLEPGSYFLEVRLLGYETVQSGTSVEAGEISSVLRIQLKPNPSTLPTAVTLQAAGHTGCSFLFGITSLRWACDDVDPPQHARFDIGGSAPEAIQAEMSWRSTQLAGNEMRMFVRNANEAGSSINADYIGLISGPSPLTCTTPLGVSCSDDTGLSNETWTGRVNVDGASGCATGCVDSPLGPAGAGVMIDQDYDVFLTVFRNMLPSDGWTYIADGNHPTP